VICCELQPLNDDVTVTGVPVGIPVIAVVVIVPKEEVIIAPLGLLILILYVSPLQIPALNDANGDPQGVEQSNGEFTLIEVEHNPSIAVNITVVPIGILITVFPETVPALAEISAF
jgi:hypothetical protein